MSNAPSNTPKDPSGPPGPDPEGPAVDPIRVRRAQVAKWTLLANRVGYLFIALAMALFVIAFAVGFSSTMATLVTITFVIGCVLLAPSIIVGYAVKAAERDDRERGF
jgi:Na+/proline symporter